jgi:hypothetical protein
MEMKVYIPDNQDANSAVAVKGAEYEEVEGRMSVTDSEGFLESSVGAQVARSVVHGEHYICDKSFGPAPAVLDCLPGS